MQETILVCIENETPNEGRPAYGGFGWSPGLIFKTKDKYHQNNNLSTIYWRGVGGGVYHSHVRMATETEINAFHQGITNIFSINKEFSLQEADLFN